VLSSTKTIKNPGEPRTHDVQKARIEPIETWLNISRGFSSPRLLKIPLWLHAIVTTAHSGFGTQQCVSLTQRHSLPGGVALLVPASAFVQVNQHVNHTMVQAVLRAAAGHSITSFADAYAGAGNFTLPLLAHGLTGEALDSHAAGIYCARGVARDMGFAYEGFQVGDACHLMESFAAAKRRFDLVLLDPRRQGAKGALAAALRLFPHSTSATLLPDRHVAYVPAPSAPNP
jgi:hypothetical protein